MGWFCIVMGAVTVVFGRVTTWGLPETTALTEGWYWWLSAIVLLVGGAWCVKGKDAKRT